MKRKIHHYRSNLESINVKISKNFKKLRNEHIEIFVFFGIYRNIKDYN